MTDQEKTSPTVGSGYGAGSIRLDEERLNHTGERGASLRTVHVGKRRAYCASRKQWFAENCGPGTQAYESKSHLRKMAAYRLVTQRLVEFGCEEAGTRWDCPSCGGDAALQLLSSDNGNGIKPNCVEGCKKVDIIELLGLGYRDLYDENLGQP